MPVILEQIHQPSPDDLHDLIKIYQDYPEAPVNRDDTTDLSQWISNRLASGQRIFAGRFNGRLLAAVWCHSDPHCLQLEDLCVRALTRRRGVARQLLTLLIQQARKQQLALQITLPTASIALHTLLSELGFTSSNHQLWTLPAQP